MAGGTSAMIFAQRIWIVENGIGTSAMAALQRTQFSAESRSKN
jgi:hypothetical protein